jgi:hypothetical protein
MIREPPLHSGDETVRRLTEARGTLGMPEGILKGIQGT